MGSLFELEGGRLTMVSVDGYRMAIRREDVKGGTDGMRFIIPGSALLDVERLCGRHGRGGPSERRNKTQLLHDRRYGGSVSKARGRLPEL